METGYFPVRLTKLWMKYLCFRANRNASLGNVDARCAVFRQIHRDIMSGEKIQNRHYGQRDTVDIPLNFYEYFMGKYLNFASGYFSTGAEDLDSAEEAALWMVSEKSRIRDGMTILEIGCNNGAFATYIAENFPNCQIIALSDSAKSLTQLQRRAKDRGFDNVEFLSKDFAEIKAEKQFDRIICLERFDLIGSVIGWEKKIKALLSEEGFFFLQTPVHYANAYYADSVGFEDYPGNNLIQDLITPSFKSHMLTNPSLQLFDCWEVSGEHYKMTADKWFKKFIFNKEPVLRSLQKAYGQKEASKWYERWKLYLLSLYEKFGYNNGQYWVIGQYLYK